MAQNEYHFRTRWRVEGTVAEVYQIMSDSVGITRWWPAVWLRAEILEPGGPRSVGRVVQYVSKGWLPYILRWRSLTLETNPPHGFTLQASGDFEGRGRWTFTPAGPLVDMVYDWDIRADKPLLRYFSFLFKPLFASNHNWAMGMGEKSLRLELARRRAPTEAERQQIPAPPPPVFLSRRQRRKLGLARV